MKERPILFSGPMVRAILDGRKTQTRRIVGLSCFKPSETPGYAWTFRGRAPVRSVAQQLRHPRGCWQDLHHDALLKLCPYGKAGDRLWVRETWAVVDDHHDTVSLEAALDSARKGCPWAGIIYKAGHGGGAYDEDHRVGGCWRPSIHMPRWASRITLEVTEVRVERLQAISEEDARAEGVEGLVAAFDTRKAFQLLWDSINADRASWASNPFVWAISFRRVP